MKAEDYMAVLSHHLVVRGYQQMAVREVVADMLQQAHVAAHGGISLGACPEATIERVEFAYVRLDEGLETVCTAIGAEWNIGNQGRIDIVLVNEQKASKL